MWSAPAAAAGGLGHSQRPEHGTPPVQLSLLAAPQKQQKQGRDRGLLIQSSVARGSQQVGAARRPPKGEPTLYAQAGDGKLLSLQRGHSLRPLLQEAPEVPCHGEQAPRERPDTVPSMYRSYVERAVQLTAVNLEGHLASPQPH